MLNLIIKNKTVHIKKNPIKINQILNFQAVDSLNNLKIIKLNELAKKKKIISSVPSIDTATCILQTTKFNSYIAKNFSDYIIITISKDLPFAQQRFCENLKINKNFHIWSDYRNDSNNFANTTSLIIDELQLLARSIMVLDENNKILYQQIAFQVDKEPNYDQVLNFLNQLEKN